jgi:membrane-associated phospholipid phosphatase
MAGRPAALGIVASREMPGVHCSRDVLAGAALGAITGSMAAQWLP